MTYRIAINYHRLRKQLIEHGPRKVDTMHRAKISNSVLARLSKGEPISMDSMEKIYTVLNGNISDMVEFVSGDPNGGKGV